MAIEQALLWLFTKTESPELCFSCCLSLTSLTNTTWFNTWFSQSNWNQKRHFW